MIDHDENIPTISVDMVCNGFERCLNWIQAIVWIVFFMTIRGCFG